MKRAALLLLGCLAFAANAATDIYVSISYTSGANTYAAGQSTTVPSMVAACVSQTNNSYVSQGIDVRYVQATVAAGNGQLPDSATMDQQFNWARNSLNSLQSRKNLNASMAIVISAPGPTVLGSIPAVPPARAADANGAINVADLCHQLEDALSRNLGAGNGYQTRTRTYPYQGSNVCFHTRESLPSDPNQQVPNLSYWRTGGSGSNTASDAATPSVSCEQYRLWLISQGASMVSNASSQTVVVGGAQYCNIYNSGGTQVSNQGITFTAGVGSSTIGCGVAGDFQLDRYSAAPPANYLGYPIGSASQDSLANMNARVSKVAGFGASAANLLANAQAAACTLFCWD